MKESQQKEAAKAYRTKKIGPRSQSPIYVWVTPEEKKRIYEYAQDAKLPASSYVRARALGEAPKSKTDKDLLLIFRKICSDIENLCRYYQQTKNPSLKLHNEIFRSISQQLEILEKYTDLLKKELSLSRSCQQR